MGYNLKSVGVSSHMIRFRDIYYIYRVYVTYICIVPGTPMASNGERICKSGGVLGAPGASWNA